MTDREWYDVPRKSHQGRYVRILLALVVVSFLVVYCWPAEQIREMNEDPQPEWQPAPGVVWLSPPTKTVKYEPDVPVFWSILVRNENAFPVPVEVVVDTDIDAYNGLDRDWLSMSEQSFTLAPGGSRMVTFGLTVPGSHWPAIYNFMVGAKLVAPEGRISLAAMCKVTVTSVITPTEGSYY